MSVKQILIVAAMFPVAATIALVGVYVPWLAYPQNVTPACAVTVIKQAEAMNAAVRAFQYPALAPPLPAGATRAGEMWHAADLFEQAEQKCKLRP